MMAIRDVELKEDFIAYLQAHPELRFWQALRSWSEHSFILVSEEWDDVREEYLSPEDTFYWEGRK